MPPVEPTKHRGAQPTATEPPTRSLAEETEGMNPTPTPEEIDAARLGGMGEQQKEEELKRQKANPTSHPTSHPAGHQRSAKE